MLNSVKAMILEKQEYLEAAQIIFEDAVDVDIDNLIILNESAEDPEDENDMDDIKDVEKNENDEDEVSDPSPEEDLGGTEITDNDEPDEPAEDDVLNSPIGNNEDEPTLADDGDLPDIVGKQTGEPIRDDIDDFLNVSVDLRSNTITDVLPVPPNNAGEAIASDDILSSRIDSGFGNEEDLPFTASSNDDDIMNENMEESYTIDTSDDLFSEAISLDGGSESADEPDDEKSSEETPDEDLGNTPEDIGENEVTSAVRDKVAEADVAEEGEVKSTSKEDLLKKLGSITKSLEDAKRAVMNTIQ